MIDKGRVFAGQWSHTGCGDAASEAPHARAGQQGDGRRNGKIVAALSHSSLLAHACYLQAQQSAAPRACMNGSFNILYVRDI
eukprot:5858714-Prymnesium_polylepis.1